MSRKRFSISDDIARGIRNTVSSVSGNSGQLHYEMMAIDVIELDPENPRKMSITINDIKHGLANSDPDIKKKQKEYEALQSLAKSISKVGVRNAIEVYKHHTRYRLISGERRLLASLLAAKTHIPVRISQRPDEYRLRYLQWIENIQREDLTLWEKFINLQQLVQAYRQTSEAKISADVISELLGVSQTQAYKYLALLKCNDKLRELIKEGSLNSLKLYHDIYQLKDEQNRNLAVETLSAQGRSLGDSLTLNELLNRRVKPQSKKKLIKTKSGRGRPSQTINLGKLKNTEVAKRLIEIVLTDKHFDKHQQEFQQVDWSSPKQVSHAFQRLLTLIEHHT